MGVTFGAVKIPITELLYLFKELISTGQNNYIPDYRRVIIFDLRLPRIVLMAVTGAALSTAGAAYQGMFRNPLADPFLVGVASGAGLGATFVFSFAPTLLNSFILAIPIGAFIGGLITVIIVITVAQKKGMIPIHSLLLSGVAMGSFCSAITTLWMLRSPNGLQQSFSYLMGGYGGGGWRSVWATLPFFLVGFVVLRSCGKGLNLLQLSEEEAKQLGVNTERLKYIVIGAATLMTAAAVSFGGLIGFVGLIVPHLLRLLAGPDYRRLLTLSAVGGAGFLILSDLLARTILSPQELPVGIITALTGAPFFLTLLRRAK